MNKKTVLIIVALAMVGVMASFSADAGAAGATKPGLVGLICEKKDFREPASRDVIKHVNYDWTGGPNDWSGYWQGYIEAPFTGEVTFIAEADNGIKLAIGGAVVINGLGRGKARVGKVSTAKGKKYPIKLWYFQDGDPSYLRLYWSWAGRDKVLVDESAFSYSPKDVEHVIGKLPGKYWSVDDAPVHVTGKGSESLDLSYQHGRLAPIVGVQNYQVYRGNREHPEFTGGLRNTYIHAPMLAYWNGTFYLEFLAAPKDEHQDPTVTLLTTSRDGRHWSTPKVIFPPFTPKGDSHQTISHQRMGFYVSPNNRLLVLSFYGRWPSPNEGDGVGRAVREIHNDGTLGPLYFIRYNRHAGWNETNTPYPFYKESGDKGFIEVCDTLMANKLMVQQWYEEDRSTDGFYVLEGDGFCCKAFDWYTRKDGRIVGFWKAGCAALSSDGGKTWSERKKLPSIIVGHAKMWGQRTDDGRFAFVYNPHFEWRFPLVVNTGDDGRVFSNMACIHGEMPNQRYEGGAKDMGPQYVRGITPGNGNPPGDDMWLVYSVNKEDIWASKVPVPVRDRVDEWVDDTFDGLITGGTVDNWNIYCPVWATVEVAEYPGVADKSLKLSDKEPYDYAKAARVFPNSKTVTVKFDLLARQTKHGRMEIEILSRTGTRPVRITLSGTGKIAAVDGGKTVELLPYSADTWLSFKINVNTALGKYNLAVNGKDVLRDAHFAEKTDAVHRISFRTGKYRRLGKGLKQEGASLPNAGNPAKEAIYYINKVSVWNKNY